MPCFGQCLDQCDYNGNLYIRSNCVEKCLPVQCPNYKKHLVFDRYCDVIIPEEILDCHEGLCPNCAIYNYANNNKLIELLGDNMNSLIYRNDAVVEQIYLKIPYNDIKFAKKHDVYFDSDKKIWYIYSNNKFKDILLNKYELYNSINNVDYSD